MTGFDCYRTYLAFKNHFTKDNFDYFKYGGKTNATTTSFNKRKDKYFFEKMSRQKKDEDIVDYCEKNAIDVESVPKLISKPLKEKLKWEATELNYLKRTSRAKLPL